MKISLEWLNDYLPGAPREIGAQRAADVLMNGGLPVETIEQVGDDTVIDVEVTSNRADCLSHVGVARELAGLLGRTWKAPPSAPAEGPVQITAATSVELREPSMCPYYSARIIRGVKVGPSPAWLIRRLQAIIRKKGKEDGRDVEIPYKPINNVVDVTNYVLMELGQPLHAFDFDKLSGARVVIRRANKGETLVTIDGKTRELTDDMLVIADAQKPVALAGVMGGKASEVEDGTVNILLEAARFDPLTVRRTSRALALHSDSSYRFERGIDPMLTERASLRAAQLILEIAGGELLAGAATGGDASFSPRPVTLRLSKIRSVLGIDVPAAEAMSALARLGFAPATKGEAIECTVPSWRQDVSIEVDLVEEVARAIGYDRIPVKQVIEIRVTPPQEDLRAVDQIRAALVAAGYFEALTFSWVTDALRDDFKPAEAKGLLRADESVRKDNAHLRPSMIPGLLEAVRRNETVGNPRAKLFEIGSTFWVDRTGKVDERRRVALVGSPDYREVRGAVEALLESLDAARDVKVVPDEHAGFARGACGRVEWGGRAIGYIGKVDAAVLQKLDLREAPAAAELELEPLIAGAQWLPQVRDLPKFPSVKRDLSLVVAERIRYEEIEAIVRELKLQSLEAVQYVTTYRGKQIGPGSKSVTIELMFRSDTGTLTSEAVEGSVQRVVGAAKEKVGATLRV